MVYTIPEQMFNYVVYLPCNDMSSSFFCHRVDFKDDSSSVLHFANNTIKSFLFPVSSTMTVAARGGKYKQSIHI